MLYEKEALEYHSQPRPGKIEVVPLKPCRTQGDLSLAYSPGVAVPCLEIKKNPELSYEYTSRGNLIGVITNGTAVLGLGNIGPLAGKPVMEGKGVLFKRFANIDVFDIEVNTTDPDEFIRTVKLLEPTFGGINLEDIKAPDCFYIEERLSEQMSIPVFHDDQHGTAIISAAGLINAAELTGRKLEEMRVVINGAGAAGIACARIYTALGVRKENILLLDTKGIVYVGRQDGMNPYKEAFAIDTPLRTLEEAVEGADALVGLSVKGAFTETHLKRMREKPIVFALANPEAEIDYYDAKKIRPDAIVATGRSDFPNQVNNVLGFPYIFRGALDVRATKINEAMKMAAVYALAELAREDVPDAVIRAYGGAPIRFGTEYIIPKPFDTRVLLRLVPAVAQAAVNSGVAQIPLPDTAQYVSRLEAQLGPEREVMNKLVSSAQKNPKRIVLPEGCHPVILRAAQFAAKEGIVQPVLLGKERKIRAMAAQLQVSLDHMEIIDPMESPLLGEFTHKLFGLRQRKGWTLEETKSQLCNPFIFGAMMVRERFVDGQVHGITMSYPNAIRPLLQVIPRRTGVSTVAGLYLMLFKNRTFLFADCTVNVDPNSDDLAEIAILASEMAEFFGMTPRVAMLSFSNFGNARNKLSEKVVRAVDTARRRKLGMVIEGEMHADTAVMESLLNQSFPFNRLGGPANVLIFPDLNSGNISYKLLERLGGATAIGPLLIGLSKPINVLPRNAEMENVVNVITVTVAQAQHLDYSRSLEWTHGIG
jgi:malate dehydrogenase (oxaloacetate-decarboxylating)(NADP+)